MKLHFFKYQATGNDFVLVDNRSGSVRLSLDQIKHICDRRFGVGADGLMLLEKHPSLDFDLIYFNSDGSQSLCGNGTRAAIKMASSLGMINGKASFNAYDGKHQAELFQNGIVKVRMNDVDEVKKDNEDWIIHTGSPHFIRFVKNLSEYPVLEEGKKIRYSESYQPGGTNVNFVELLPNNTIFVRTYERGVENETLSCGTGVTAAALAAHFKQYKSPVTINSLGGNLSVEFKALQTHGSHHPLPDRGVTNREGTGQAVLPTGPGFAGALHEGTFHDIFLIGPAKMVFEGELEL